MGSEATRASTVEFMGTSDMNELFTYAHWMMENPEDSSAVLREAYLKTFGRWRSDQDNSEIRLDLFRVVRDIIIRFRDTGNRKNRRGHRAPDAGPIGRPESPKGTADPVTEPVTSFLETLVRRTIRLMPEEYGSAVLLCDIDNLSYAEISKIMRCPVDEVRRRIHAGRRLLREQLADYLHLLVTEPAVNASALP